MISVGWWRAGHPGLGRAHVYLTLMRELVAHHLYDQLDQGQVPGEALANAISLAVSETADAHRVLWDEPDHNERLVLIAIASGAGPMSRQFARAHHVPRSTLDRAFRRLLKPERHVAEQGGAARIVDPLFAEWIRRS